MLSHQEADEDIFAENNLKLFLYSMVFSSMWLMITTQSPLTGFLGYLDFTDFTYGFMMSLPYFAALFQILGSHFLNGMSEKKVLYVFPAMVRGVMWILIGIIPILPGRYSMPVIMGCAVVAAVSGAFVNVTLTTMLGLIISGKIIGKYLAKRNRIGVMANLGCGLMVSLLLDHMIAPYNYMIIFGAAGICSLADASIIWKVKEGCVSKGKDIKENCHKEPTIRQMFSNSRFRGYVIFWVAWNFSYYIASPFNAKYCLGPLKMTFTQFTIGCDYLYYAVTITALPLWGTFIDRYGCKNTIKVAFTIISLLGFLWLGAKPYHILTPVLFYGFGGTVWCLVELLSQHMMISQTPASNRASYIAVYSALAMVIGQGLSILTGGAVMEMIDALIGNGHLTFGRIALDKYQLLFLFACLLRGMVLVLLLPLLKEEKDIPLIQVARDILTYGRKRYNG